MSVFVSVSMLVCAVFSQEPAAYVYKGSGGQQSAPIPIQVDYQGYAAHYNYGVMEIVLANRGMEGYYCNVASTYEAIGTRLRVQSLLTGHTEICLVTDEPHPAHQARIESKGVAIEFGWRDQLMWDMCRLSYVGQEPPRACPVAIQVLTP